MKEVSDLDTDGLYMAAFSGIRCCRRAGDDGRATGIRDE